MYFGSSERISANVSGYSEANAASATPLNRSPPVRLPFKRKIAATPAEPASTNFFQFSILFLRSARTFDWRARARWSVLVIASRILRVFGIATLEDLDAQSQAHGMDFSSAFLHIISSSTKQAAGEGFGCAI